MATITALETVILRLPYRRVVSFKSVSEDTGEYVLLRLKLSDGQEGIAESVTRPLQTGDDGRILAHVLSEFLAPMVIGVDPLASATIERRLRTLKGQHAAKSLLDVALWDARGKVLGLPVRRLLGGDEDRVPLTWVVHGKDVETMLAEAKERAEGGWALKLKAHGSVENALSLVHQVRETVADDVLIYVDANSNYNPADGRRLVDGLRDYRVSFIEEPCSFASVQEQARFAASSPIPLLGDQSVQQPQEVYAYASMGAIGAVSVKPRRSGVTESLRSVAICRAAGLPVLVGTDSESRIGALARLNLRAGASQDMAPWPTETHFFDKLADDVFAGEFAFEHGSVTLSDAPGFGAGIDESKLADYAVPA